ncbi:MAG: metal-dependent hydrolase [Chloroflexia bacterium]|nr:metal-dependent hydrolase [Chloroflexia bacterium]
MWNKHSGSPTSTVTEKSSPLDFLAFVILLAVATGSWVAIAVLRLAEPGPQDRTLTIHGIYDETGHLLTALMVAAGLRAMRLPIPIWSVLVGGVILDVGHVMIQLDFSEPIDGSSRNGTHSILIVTVIAIVGLVDQRRAILWLGITIGALSHLWRDMGTGLVPLAWPFSDEIWGTSFTRYMVGLAALTVAMIGSGALLAIHERANHDAGAIVPAPDTNSDQPR